MTTTKEYQVGALAVNTARYQELPARKNRPALSVIATGNMPAAANTMYGEPVLSCAPTATYNALGVIGEPASPETLRLAKRHTNDSSNATATGDYLPLVENLHPGFLVEALLEGRYTTSPKITLHKAIAMMREHGYTTAVVCTRTPAHAFVIHLDEYQTYLVDNGGFRDVDRWQARNINQVYGIKSTRPQHEPEPEPEPELPQLKRFKGASMEYKERIAKAAARRKEMVARYEAGADTYQLAEEFGICQTAVMRALKKEGVTLRPRGRRWK